MVLSMFGFVRGVGMFAPAALVVIGSRACVVDSAIGAEPRHAVFDATACKGEVKVGNSWRRAIDTRRRSGLQRLFSG